jgi:hypothetical protein
MWSYNEGDCSVGMRNPCCMETSVIFGASGGFKNITLFTSQDYFVPWKTSNVVSNPTLITTVCPGFLILLRP